MKTFRLPHLKKSSYDTLMILVIIFFIAFFGFIGLSRHSGYLTSMNDLGHFDQAVWGATQNGILLNSHIFNFKINHLGFHFTPILYAFVPFYKILPTVNWLIFAQAICIAVSAWPIYLLANKIIESKKSAFLWGIVYLFNPYLQNGAAWDFHPMMIALPFISLAIYYLFEKRLFPLVICSTIIMMCKEHFGIMIIGFGILWYYKHRELKKSLVLTFAGLFHFLFVFKYLMPLLSPTGEHLMLSKGQGHFSRYTWLGSSAKEIFLSIFKGPHKVFYISLFKMGGLSYLILLLLPFLGLSLLGLPILIPAIADVAANILSANGMPRSIFAYHSATIIPFLCTSAICGSKFLQSKIKRFTINDYAIFAIVLTLTLFYIASPYPLPISTNFWAPKNFINKQDSSLKVVRSLVPSTVSLSAQGNVAAHFTHRESIYLFPNMIGNADAILLKLESPTTNFYPPDPTRIGTLAHHLQLNPCVYLDTILSILSKQDYGITFWKNNWLLLRKNQPDVYSKKIVKESVYELKERWGNLSCSQ